jgi:hypothetical protein
MASTRFSNDKGRILKRNAIDTVVGRYMLDTPGQGLDLPFNADPHFRIQGWGGSALGEINNLVDINSDLRGLTRPANKDLLSLNDYKKYAVKPDTPYFATQKEINYLTDETRATAPAWMLKDVAVGDTRWIATHLNPIDLNYLNKPFYENMNTRILVKDSFDMRRM